MAPGQNFGTKLSKLSILVQTHMGEIAGVKAALSRITLGIRVLTVTFKG